MPGLASETLASKIRCQEVRLGGITDRGTPLAEYYGWGLLISKPMGLRNTDQGDQSDQGPDHSEQPDHAKDL